MANKDYKGEIRSLSPVAVRTHQREVSAPDHDTWGTVTCDGCKAEFFIGPNRIYGSRTTQAECVKQLEGILAQEHAMNHDHQNIYELNG